MVFLFLCLVSHSCKMAAVVPNISTYSKAVSVDQATGFLLIRFLLLRKFCLSYSPPADITLHFTSQNWDVGLQGELGEGRGAHW